MAFCKEFLSKTSVSAVMTGAAGVGENQGCSLSGFH